MIDTLKELEQEAMDNITPEDYMEITSKIMREEDQVKYQCGYIDGLQTAIRLLSENDTTMSYTIEIDDIFDNEDEQEDN